MKIHDETLQGVLVATHDLRDTPVVGELVKAARQEMLQEAWETPEEQLSERYKNEQDFEDTWTDRIRRIVG